MSIGSNRVVYFSTSLHAAAMQMHTNAMFARVSRSQLLTVSVLAVQSTAARKR
jgi:hypothetical protein